jgi:hypothetical protein
LGLDKKMRPYLHCVACGVRSFMPIYECLHGLAIVPALVQAWRQRTSEEARRAHLVHYLNDLRNRAREGTVAPAATADAALAAALEKVA